ncbi:hypothetical protein AB1K70_26220 [Bremerella sp. JC770]|uniref:hypothetical protein n=1 Tax=Bremerella sp. JC770 TaxID=3232137 RepID=UPI00345ADC43
MSSDHPDSSSSAIPAPLRPPASLVVASIVVMLAGATIISVAMVGLELLWPSSLCILMLLTLGIGLAIMLGQYFGTFRGSPRGARYATIGSFTCFFLIHAPVLILRKYTVDWTQPDASVTSLEESLLVVPIMVIASLTCGWINGRWAWKLWKHSQDHPPQSRSISLREVLAFCAVMGVLMIPTSYRASVNRSLYQANIAVDDAPIALPTGAQAIEYERQRDGRILVSFEIDETSFRQWLVSSDSDVHKHGGTLEEITSPLNVHRPDPSRIPLPISEGNTSVSQGLSVYWQTETLHHAITYDRATNTAYYQELMILE